MIENIKTWEYKALKLYIKSFLNREYNTVSQKLVQSVITTFYVASVRTINEYASCHSFRHHKTIY